MARLVLCSGCARHFRRTEAACPFCDQPSEASALPEPTPLSRGISRAKRYAMQAAILAGTATLAHAGTCGGSGNQEVRHVDDDDSNRKAQPNPVPHRQYDDDDMPAKPYGCVWADPEEDERIDV